MHIDFITPLLILNSSTNHTINHTLFFFIPFILPIISLDPKVNHFSIIILLVDFLITTT